MRKLNSFRRKSSMEIIIHCVISFIFMAFAISYVFILLWAFIAGLRTNTEIVMNPFGLPEKANWHHYIEVFSKLEVNHKNFFDMFLNSAWFSIAGPLLQQFFTITLAYTCSKYKFPGSKLAYPIVLIIITLPIYGTGGAMYKLVHNLGLIDSYAYVLLSAAGLNINFLYYSAYFKNLSWSYAEAAMIDGANDFQIYFKVMFPQAKPIFGALFLTSWLANWNSYEAGLIYYPHLPTLPVGIYQFNLEMIYRARLDILFAACFLVSIPAIILFIVFNKTITSNVSLGGLKG